MRPFIRGRGRSLGEDPSEAGHMPGGRVLWAPGISSPGNHTMTLHSHRMGRTSPGWAGTILSQKGRSEELSQGRSLERSVALTSHPHNRVELDAVGIEMAWKTRTLILDSLQSHQPKLGQFIFSCP